MAGRGTDILLGGNPEFMARQQCLAEQIVERLPKGQERFVDDEEFVYFFHLDSFYRVGREAYERVFEHFRTLCAAEHEEVVRIGGLHIIGTERHEARRIDNQLRGRAGRQGDPGSSRFYLSLEDDLMRIFGAANIAGLMQRLGMEEGVPIEHNMVTKAIARAQKQVEAQNFSIRKHLLEYDDVMNKQRENIYTLRRSLLDGRIQVDDDTTVGPHAYVMTIAEDVIDAAIEEHCGKDSHHEEWDLATLRLEIEQTFGLEPQAIDELGIESLKREELREALWTAVRERYEEKSRMVGRDVLRLPDDVKAAVVGADRLPSILSARDGEGELAAGVAVLEPIERNIMLQVVDTQWKDHLYSLDHLKDGIGLRGYGQRDPLVEYKKESFALFQGMRERVDEESLRYLWRLRPIISDDGAAPVPAARRPAPQKVSTNQANLAAATASSPMASRAAAALGGASSGAAPRPARVGGDDATVKTVRRDEPKLGRNDPCWCGSGKKYKKCHGA